jgi:hypothetical protein
MGSIPALTILCLAAKYDMPKAVAISCIVTPVILLLSAFYLKNIKTECVKQIFLRNIKYQITIFLKSLTAKYGGI